MRLKAQASLEMVVGLIILLVVAGVVIGLVLYFIKPDVLPNPAKSISKNQFQADCDSYCSSKDYISFCSRYWLDTEKTPSYDWDNNKIQNENIEIGPMKWTTCESRIYCFLSRQCEGMGDGGLETIERCKTILCQTFMSKYKNTKYASDEIKSIIDVNTACTGLSSLPDKDNWYKKVFSTGCS